MSDSNPPEAPLARPMSFFSAAIWSLIALLVNIVIVGVMEEGKNLASVDTVSRTACLALAYSVVLFGVLRLHEPETSIRHVLALRTPSALSVLLGLVVGASLALPTDWLDKVLETRFPSPPEVEEITKATLSVGSVGKAVALFVTLGVVDPILSELFYRGVLFTPLRRTRNAQTVIFAIAAFESFTNLSYSPRITIALLAATLVFSWVRGVTGNVFPAIAAHIAFNAMSVVPMALRKPDLEPTRTLLAVSGASAILGLVGLSFVARSAAARDARQRDAGELPL